MSTPNPLAPQGSLLEQHGRGKSTFQILSFIVGLHLVFLCGVLWIGCKKEDKSPDSAFAGSDAMPPVNQGVDPYSPPMMPAQPAVTVPPGFSGYTGDTTGLVPPSPADLQRYDQQPSTIAPPPPPASSGAGVIPPRDTSSPSGSRSAPGTPPAPPAPSTTTHKVQRGDTGYGIANRYGVTFRELQSANPRIDWNRLKVNEEINIPQPGARSAASTSTSTSATTSSSSQNGEIVYAVKRGDTGLRIERQFGVPWKEIRRHNRLTSDTIKVGQNLVIPAKGRGAVTETPSRPSAIPLQPSSDQPGSGFPRK